MNPGDWLRAIRISVHVYIHYSVSSLHQQCPQRVIKLSLVRRKFIMVILLSQFSDATVLLLICQFKIIPQYNALTRVRRRREWWHVLAYIRQSATFNTTSGTCTTSLRPGATPIDRFLARRVIHILLVLLTYRRWRQLVVVVYYNIYISIVFLTLLPQFHCRTIYWGPRHLRLFLRSDLTEGDDLCEYMWFPTCGGHACCCCCCCKLLMLPLLINELINRVELVF